MGGYCFIDAVTTPVGEEQGCLLDLGWNVLEMVSDYAQRFTGSDEAWNSPDLLDGDLEVEEQDNGFMIFSRGYSPAIIAHWLELAYSAHFQYINQKAQESGWMLEEPKPLKELLDKKEDKKWIKVNDEYYSYDKYLSSEDFIEKNGETFQKEDFTAEQIKLIEDAKNSGLCQCMMCQMLRGEENFEKSMVEFLGDSNPEVAKTGLWYLQQTIQLSINTVTLIAEKAIHTEPRDHADVCFDIGGKIDIEHLQMLIDKMEQTQDIMPKCGYLALIAGLKIDDIELAQQRYLLFEKALEEQSVVSAVALEYAGYANIAKGNQDAFAAKIVTHIGSSDEYDHNAALTLFNMYNTAATIPAFVADGIHQLANHSSTQVLSIASFAQHHFLKKSTH